MKYYASDGRQAGSAQVSDASYAVVLGSYFCSCSSTLSLEVVYDGLLVMFDDDLCHDQLVSLYRHRRCLSQRVIFPASVAFDLSLLISSETQTKMSSFASD